MIASTYAAGHTWTAHELIDLIQRRPEWVSTVINQALAEDADARWAWVVDRYLDQQISLSKAAELLNLHVLVLRDRFQHLGIPVRVGPADLADAKAEVESARRYWSYTFPFQAPSACS